MSQSLSSSMQGYYGSEKVVEEEVKPYVPASVNQKPQLPYSASYNINQFFSVNGVPPLAFREPIPIAERINGAKTTIRDFDGKMIKG